MATEKRICPHCGRTWISESGTWSGFVQSSYLTHTYNCEGRAPRERVARALKDSARWKRKPPKRATVTDDFNHKGMRE